jgi:hypothetical protein
VAKYETAPFGQVNYLSKQELLQEDHLCKLDESLGCKDDIECAGAKQIPNCLNDAFNFQAT